MATRAEAAIPLDDNPVGDGLAAFVDRWIFVFMAAMLIAVVLIGFIPDSLQKIAEVGAGERPAFPIQMHLHAVLMGSWLLLLFTQTILMATGKRGLHMQLGLLGMVLAPMLVVAGVLLVPANFASRIDFAQGAAPEVSAQLPGFLNFMTNIALLQLRAGFCFLVLVILGLHARKHDPSLHKRLMILATIVPMPAALDRMQFLPHSLPNSPLTVDLWPLFLIAPMFVWDLYRQRRIHRAYWYWLGVIAPTGILLNVMWNSEWWHRVAPPILYG